MADFRANEKFYPFPACQEIPFAHRMGEGGRRSDDSNYNHGFIGKFWLLPPELEHQDKTQPTPFMSSNFTAGKIVERLELEWG